MNLSAGAGGTTENLGDVLIASGTSTLNFSPGYQRPDGHHESPRGERRPPDASTPGPRPPGHGQPRLRAAAGNGVLNIKIDNVSISGSGTAPAITGLGASNIGLVGGNTVGFGIRADVLAQDSSGLGFVTYDVNGFRPLTQTEYNPFPNQPVLPDVCRRSCRARSPNVCAHHAGFLDREHHDRQPQPELGRQSGRLRPPGLAGAGYYSSALGTSYVAANLAVPNGAAFVDWNANGTLNTTTLNSGVILSNTGNAGIQGGQLTSPAARRSRSTPRPTCRSTPS